MFQDNEHKIIEIFKKTVVHVISQEVEGTGFFIAPELVLTCAHIIDQQSLAAIKIRYQGKEYLSAIEYIEAADNIDIALLKIQSDIHEHPCALLDQSSPRIENDLYSYGHPEGKYNDGDSVTLTYEGESYNDGYLIYKLKSGEVGFGFSGSPVLNRHTGAVCCMISASRCIDTFLGARATPISVVTNKLPKLLELQAKFHFSINNEWVFLLSYNTEAVASDWKILNLSKSRLKNYFATIWFLAKTLFVWTLFGRIVSYSFPIEELKHLFWKARAGKLGEELCMLANSLKMQKSYFSYASNISPEQLNYIDSKYWLVTEIIEIASPKSVSKEISRIFQTVEALDEDRTEIIEIKERERKGFERWESLKGTWEKFSDSASGRLYSDYRSTEDLLNQLIFQHVNQCTSIIKNIEILFSKMNVDSSSNLYFYSTYRGRILDMLSEYVLEASNFIDTSVRQIQYSLDKAVKKNPTLKLLLKTKILVDLAAQRTEPEEISISNRPPIRVKQSINKNKYHFHADCDRYPKIEKKGELVLCFETREEAEKDGYEACTICLNKVNIAELR
jgi:hypothetical protein